MNSANRKTYFWEGIKDALSLRSLMRVAVWLAFICGIALAIKLGISIGTDPLGSLLYAAGCLGVVALVYRLFEVIDSIPSELNGLTDELKALKKKVDDIEDRLSSRFPSFGERMHQVAEQMKSLEEQDERPDNAN